MHHLSSISGDAMCKSTSYETLEFGGKSQDTSYVAIDRQQLFPREQETHVYNHSYSTLRGISNSRPA